MKIAATYEKETGNVFQHFGKTQFFKIYEIEDGKILSSEVIDNDRSYIPGPLSLLDAGVFAEFSNRD